MRSAKSGIVLAALVMVIAFAAITVFSVTMLVIQSVSRADAAHKRMKCYYAARAGLVDSAYSCRLEGGHWQSGLEFPAKTYIEDKVYFILQQTQADNLLLDTHSAFSGKSQGKKEIIGGIMLYNAVPSGSLTVSGLNISWTQGGKLRKIIIGGKNVWTGKQDSPAACDIKFVSLSASGVSIDSLQFDDDASESVVKAVFLMSDGSKVEKKLYPASSEVILHLKIAGGMDDSSVSYRLSADCNLVSGIISSVEEVRDAS